MRKPLVRAVALVAMIAGFTGCLVAPVPVGTPVYEPPAVVVEPPVTTWRWGFWPHYEVEHHYVVNDERVIIHDRHYFPTYGRTRAYIRNDRGEHQGWYKHQNH